MAFVSKEREHNERDRVLFSDEFARVVEAAEAWLKPIVLVAYRSRHAPGGNPLAALGPSGCPAAASPAESGDTKTGDGRVHAVEWGVDSCAAIGYNIPGVSAGFREP